MERSKSKKRPASHSKVSKLSSSKLLKQKNLNPYGVKPQQNNHPTKLKIQAQAKKRENTSDYQFPEFAIYSNDTSQKEPKIKGSAVTEKNKTSRVKAKVQKSQTSRQQIQGQKMNAMRKKNYNKSITSRCQEFPKKKQKQKCLEIQFKEGLRKTFKLLDIFTRGTISEVNINKWIPQFFLYFLGKPIQKIKSQRLTLTEPQFVSLCYELLKDSSPQDLKQFIIQANSSSSLKASVTVSQLDIKHPFKEQEMMSPIKKRMIQEQMSRNYQKVGILKKNVQLDSVMEAIKTREEEINQKIRENQKKRKSVTFNPLEKVYPNQLQLSNNDSSSKPQQQSRGIQVNDFIQQKSTPLSELKQLSLKSSPYVQKSIISDRVSQVSRKIQADNPMVANFTFQLPILQASYQENVIPQPKVKVEEKPRLDYQLEMKRYQDYLNNFFKQKQEKTLEKNNEKPLSARQINQRKEQFHPQSINKSYRLNFQQDDLRLDRLKDKIESYMKKNAQKIEKSRSFFMDNSPNKL